MRSHHVVFTYNETDYEKIEELFSFESSTHFVDLYGAVCNRDFQIGVLLGSWMNTPEAKIYMKENLGMQRPLLSEVQYMESSEHVIKIHTNYGNGVPLEIWGTLTELEESLKRFGFIRVHRSYLVPWFQLQSICSDGSKHTLKLKCGEELPIGRSYWQKMKEYVGKNMMNLFRLTGYYERQKDGVKKQS